MTYTIEIPFKDADCDLSPITNQNDLVGLGIKKIKFLGNSYRSFDNIIHNQGFNNWEIECSEPELTAIRLKLNANVIQNI